MNSEMSLQQQSRRIAINLQNLRKKQNITQQQLAKKAGLPRTTLSHIESGSANPTLHNLSRIATALNIPVAELLMDPVGEIRLITKGEIPRFLNANEKVEILKLFPDKLPGIQMDKMSFMPGARFKGSPHLDGSREYFCCLKGSLRVLIEGKPYTVSKGEVLVFQGNLFHAYANVTDKAAEGISLVVLAPFS